MTQIKQKTQVKIIAGAASRQGKIGTVTTVNGTGKNSGKVEIYIDRIGHFWYSPNELEIIAEAEPQRESVFSVGFWDVDPNELKPHPANPRIYGENEDLSDLIELIPEFGIQRRLIVNIYGEIISGNRRNKTALVLKLPTVPIEVRAFKSPAEEKQLLLSENATRTKTVFQKVREGQTWQESETELAKARKRATQNNNSAGADKENFPGQGAKGQSRDIIAKRVGLGSGRNYQKALKVVEEIDRLVEIGKTDLAEALKKILNEASIDAANKILKQTEPQKEKLLDMIAKNPLLSLKEAKKLFTQINKDPEPQVKFAVGIIVKAIASSPICPGQKGEISSLPNRDSAIVLFEDGTRLTIALKYLEIATEAALPDLDSLKSDSNQPPKNTVETAVEPPIEEITGDNPPPSSPPTAKQATQPAPPATNQQAKPPLPPTEPTKPAQTPKVPKSKENKQYSSVKEKLDDKQQELGLGKPNGDSVMPETDRLDELQHSNPTDVDDRAFTSLPEPNPQIALNTFINALDNLGTEQVKVAARAIAKRKKEAIEDAATGLADNEDKAIKIIQAVLKKYPHLSKEITEEF